MTQAPITDPRFDTPDGTGGEGSGTNVIGLVGFILSLVSIIACFALSPIALVVSLIGLTKSPRLFAILGAVFSAIGTLIFLVGIAIMIAFWGLIMQLVGLGVAQVELQAHYQQNSAVPTDAEAATILSNIDFGGATPRYEIIGADSVRITLPGFDNQLDTPDDFGAEMNLDTGATQAFP